MRQVSQQNSANVTVVVLSYVSDGDIKFPIDKQGKAVYLLGLTEMENETNYSTKWLKSVKSSSYLDY